MQISQNRPLLLTFTGLALVALGMGPVAAQTREARAMGEATVPRLPDGKPDLQGFWDFRTLTPLERPESAANKPVLSEEEVRALQKQNAERRAKAAEPSDPTTARRAPGGGGLAVGGYNDFWFDAGETIVGDRRTSLITDPPDGRIPAPKSGAPHQVGSLMEDLPLSRPIRVLTAGTRASGPEDRGLAERCLVGFNSGPPMLPSGYNNHMQLVQNSNTVAVLNEMNHTVRSIPLDGGPQVPGALRQWAGVSRGHWDGDTLVVKTTNFTDKTASFVANTLVAYGSGTTLTLTERFRRLSEQVLLYEFTIEDPVTFSRPFTASVPMQKSDDPVYEYACHEGNYGLMSILRGARAEDAAK